MQQYNKQNKKLAKMAKRAFGNSDCKSDGRDKLEQNFNNNKNRQNLMDKGMTWAQVPSNPYP